MKLDNAASMNSPEAPCRRERRKVWLVGIIALITIIVSGWAHQLAGFTFPNPWNDESWMLWGSVSFLEHTTPFSEYLNFERQLFSFPVYAMVLGALFKLTGFSFALARLTSWLFLSGVYLALLRLLGKPPFRIIGIMVVSLFFLGASAVIAGNMVRPEPLVLLLASLAFVFLARGQYWKGLALASCCGLFHTAGVFFFFGAIATTAVSIIRNGDGRWPRRTDWGLLLLALILISAYFALILTHWDSYLADTRANIQVDAPGNMFARIFLSPMTRWYAAAAGLFLFCAWKEPALLPWIAFGGVCLLIPGIRKQMWYDIYRQLGFMMLTVTLPLLAWHLVHGLCARRMDQWRTGIRLAATAAYFTTLFLLLLMCRRHDWITGPNHYPRKLSWGWGMQFADLEYMQPADIQAIADALKPYGARPGIFRVFFMPEADGLFLHGRLPPNVFPYQPVNTAVRPDLFVFRQSRHYPDWWRTQYVEGRAREYGLVLEQPFYTRDGTEAWYLLDSGPRPSAPTAGPP